MSPVRGRTDDMIVVRGVNLFPSQVEAALGGVPELAPHYRLIVRRNDTLDEVVVEVELTADAHARLAEDADGPLDAALAGRVARTVRDNLGCSLEIKFVRPGCLQRSDGGKLSRVVDERELS